jgi:hypothetical protein
LSQPIFLNRQTLYLRPDPARVVVRPFKPAIEPRDLNPTDKTRANHIVGRVLGLDRFFDLHVMEAMQIAVDSALKRVTQMPKALFA